MIVHPLKMFLPCFSGCLASSSAPKIIEHPEDTAVAKNEPVTSSSGSSMVLEVGDNAKQPNFQSEIQTLQINSFLGCKPSFMKKRIISNMKEVSFFSNSFRMKFSILVHCDIKMSLPQFFRLFGIIFCSKNH